mgnify:CR=1 FL=1
MKYGFLLGQRFRVQNQVFEATEIKQLELRTIVEAVAMHDKSQVRNFPANLVVEALLVDEEIELATA